MSKTVFTLTLPEPRVRKKQPRPALAHKNKHLYSRKSKHKTDPRDERAPHQAPATTGVCRLNGVCRPGDREAVSAKRCALVTGPAPLFRPTNFSPLPEFNVTHSPRLRRQSDEASCHCHPRAFFIENALFRR